MQQANMSAGEDGGNAHQEGRRRATCCPTREQYAFQIDVLMSRQTVPPVVIELKAILFSSYDVVRYSPKCPGQEAI
ncbi:hypothetical protein ACVWZ4_000695 [Bradyrhizobium sp. USDA 4472]